MDKITSFFSIFQNANLTQKIGSAVTVALAVATALYAVLPKIIAALTAVQEAVPAQ